MRFLKRIETLFRTGTSGGLTDGQLLECFLERRDEHAEAAFAALVDRHGAMVLGVCRQILRSEDDAAQASFLVLAHRAGTIGRRESVSCWLHGRESRRLGGTPPRARSHGSDDLARPWAAAQRCTGRCRRYRPGRMGHLERGFHRVDGIRKRLILQGEQDSATIEAKLTDSLGVVETTDQRRPRTTSQRPATTPNRWNE
jgi:hypothetical protein